MRFPFFWAPEQRSAGCEFKSASPAVEVYRFTARQVVLAIAFHLVDEGLAAGVCPRSCDGLAQFLVHGGDRDAPLLIVTAAHWRRMTHRERLHWLLDRSHTRIDISVDDGVARLSPA
jgi:hypothetical protein